MPAGPVRRNGHASASLSLPQFVSSRAEPCAAQRCERSRASAPRNTEGRGTRYHCCENSRRDYFRRGSCAVPDAVRTFRYPSAAGFRCSIVVRRSRGAIAPENHGTISPQAFEAVAHSRSPLNVHLEVHGPNEHSHHPLPPPSQSTSPFASPSRSSRTFQTFPLFSPTIDLTYPRPSRFYPHRRPRDCAFVDMFGDVVGSGGEGRRERVGR
ncbi:hypothetical protein P171DRAFT_449577 [Karstenula rhodostoma CBS 690.94]|uniref:Uncharacterized protein n=1 Tax=Karstenula rhodostoma CBS 690.94 TaxID=1392251 RepID=A0A9P4P5X5_9PLEO|nr:hypothetical protein P171DRAFT_449577 [Karstenula rhodostoma CBS 690.94]